MKLTIKWLNEQRACKDGIDWFKKHKNSNPIEIINTLVAEHRFDWANWLIVRLMTHTQQVQYAVFAAEQVIEIFEAKYPNDDCPGKAIEAAKKYLENPTTDAACAAYAAAYAARAAACAAADAAADAAAYAAAYAARVAAYAADAAAYAARAAYAAYAAYAADVNFKAKIINYGINLLNHKP